MEDNLMGEQQSKKRGVKSDARKRAGSHREFDRMLASGPAAGASGKHAPESAVRQRRCPGHGQRPARDATKRLEQTRKKRRRLKGDAGNLPRFFRPPFN